MITYNWFSVLTTYEPLPDYYDFAKLLQLFLRTPYNIMFNCYYAATTSFDNPSPTPESLSANIIIVNQLITNLAFNTGYIYSDIV